jgi:hypothetical protein
LHRIQSAGDTLLHAKKARRIINQSMNQSILYFNVLTQQLQDPITVSTKIKVQKYAISYKYFCNTTTTASATTTTTTYTNSYNT